ncbi:MAG: hypothetical protein IKZ81_05790 [Clostridia bacterium]|nr:hypothetical protein [Clostridia bacterium]
MGYRTDLAAEARAEHGELDGVEVRTRTVEDVTVTETVIPITSWTLTVKLYFIRILRLKVLSASLL